MMTPCSEWCGDANRYPKIRVASLIHCPRRNARIKVRDEEMTVRGVTSVQFGQMSSGVVASWRKKPCFSNASRMARENRMFFSRVYFTSV